MLTNPTTWYAGSRYVRVDQRGVKRDVLVPFHQPAQDAVGILATQPAEAVEDNLREGGGLVGLVFFQQSGPHDGGAKFLMTATR